MSSRPKPVPASGTGGKRAEPSPQSPRDAFDLPKDLKRKLSTTGISIGLHVLVLLICSFIVYDAGHLEELVTAVVTMREPEPTPIIDSVIETPSKSDVTTTDVPVLEVYTPSILADVQSPTVMDVNDLAPQIAADDALLPGLTNLKVGDQMAGRTGAARSALVRKFGGNDETERAVATGLKWLKARQFADGFWSFAHTEHPDNPGEWSQPGSLREIRTGSTGLALLAYLGAGHTHQSGDYRDQIRDGLDALLKLGKASPNGFDLRGVPGNGHGHTAMYSHAIATLALCEAVALTKDTKYKLAAEGAVRFIVQAQDDRGGGWRYEPGQPGDTSVVGWEVMALKAASQAKFRVPSTTFRGAGRFLDSVQSEKGARYAYTVETKDAPTPTLTAAGLLCRMYLGWDNRRPALKNGVAYLDGIQPDANNMYYNYYATQVLHHWGGEEWDRWNGKMREYLVRTQLREGPEAGSWNVADPHGSIGGRLFMTTLCVMTLEVYYRHLPLYQRDRVKVEF